MTLEEKSILGRQKIVAAQKRLMRQQTDTDRVAKKLATLQADFRRLNQQSSPDRTALISLQRRTKELASVAAYADKKVVAETKQLTDQVEQALRDEETASARMKSLRKVSETVGQTEAFEQAIAAFVQTDHDPIIASHWADLSRRLEQFELDQRWVELVNDPTFVQPKAADAAQATAWAEKFYQLVAAGGGDSHFLYQRIKTAAEFMDAIGKRADAVKALQSFADSDLLKTMYVYVGRSMVVDATIDTPLIDAGEIPLHEG